MTIGSLAPTLAISLLLAPLPALAQAQGAFPAVLVCDPEGPGGRERASFTLRLGGDGRAAYRLRLGSAPPESGSGLLAGGRLTLAGSAPGAYAARYGGEITGRGGLLTGTHARAKGGRPRACQIVLGDG